MPAIPAIPSAIPSAVPSGGMPGVPGLPARPRLPDLPASGGLPAVPGRLPSLPGAVDDIGRSVGNSALKLLPVCCEGGIGARFTYDRNGVRAIGTVGMTVQQPSAGFVLGIKGGTVTDARLQIDGATGLKVSFEAARQDTRHQIDERIAIPVDFRIPILQLFAGLSLDVVVNQWIVVKTAFSATGAHLKGAGEYTFTAGIGFGYRDGSWEARTPTALTVKQSLQDSLDGLSVGPAGVVIAHQVRFTVGLSAFGFVAGVYFNLTSSIGVTRGSDAGLSLPGTGGTKRLVCKGITVSIAANFGVGYSIPAPVADVINFFLRVFRSDPVERAGGIGTRTTPFVRKVIDPDTKICGGKG